MARKNSDPTIADEQAARDQQLADEQAAQQEQAMLNEGSPIADNAVSGRTAFVVEQPSASPPPESVAAQDAKSPATAPPNNSPMTPHRLHGRLEVIEREMAHQTGLTQVKQQLTDVRKELQRISDRLDAGQHNSRLNAMATRVNDLTDRLNKIDNGGGKMFQEMLPTSNAPEGQSYSPGPTPARTTE